MLGRVNFDLQLVNITNHQGHTEINYTLAPFLYFFSTQFFLHVDQFDTV